MLIAGEASGDRLAAELVTALRAAPQLRDDPWPAEFFGAGGPHMARAGVQLAFDLTQHSVIGISEVAKKYFEFRRLFKLLLRLAIESRPDVIIGVDYGGFNLRFARVIKNHIRKHRGEFNNWNPRIVQYVSPQVWASRAGRAQQMAEDHDLLLSIFPFEKDWYAQHAPGLRVEFVGHRLAERRQAPGAGREGSAAGLLLLPGSRADELRRHLPVLLEALKLIRKDAPHLAAKMVLPNDTMAVQAKAMGLPDGLQIQVGDLAGALAQADVAITKSGTVTLECAAAGVPAVVFYKTSWPTYFIGKQIITVKYLAMPNLLADEELYPEFIQSQATPENIAAAALDLIRNEPRRQEIKAKLAKVIASLGAAGASERAAAAVLSLGK
jgi:lipid-A-disaccharide synthase